VHHADTAVRSSDELLMLVVKDPGDVAMASGICRSQMMVETRERH
jgi:hypothetical protein